jgi:hypothetical protein
MKCLVIVMSPVEWGLECEPVAMLAFKMVGTPPVGAKGCWRVLEACPEGAEKAVSCAVEPVGAGVNLTLAAIEGDNKGHEIGLKKFRQNLVVITTE